MDARQQQHRTARRNTTNVTPSASHFTVAVRAVRMKCTCHGMYSCPEK
jgi:hypothetical protein